MALLVPFVVQFDWNFCVRMHVAMHVCMFIACKNVKKHKQHLKTKLTYFSQH